MKVISGKLKGRTIKGFQLDGTRPTMDRVKESLFASIQDYIPKSTCLDLFAGSGNLGIEAISMGADKAFLCDKNRKAVETIKENIKTFGIESACRIMYGDYIKILNDLSCEKIQFDIIFLDPPYQTDFIEIALNKTTEFDLLKEDGIIICESDDLNRIKYNSTLKSIKSKKYGDKYIEILKHV